MAVNYSIPPWLDPSAAQGWGRLHAAGIQAGASLAMERQRLAQQAQQFEAESIARERSAERAYLRQQQEMEMAKAATEAQLGLRERQIAQEDAKIKMATDQAAKVYQVQEEIRRRVAAGEDYGQVYRELGPMAGLTSGAIAPLLREDRAEIMPKPFTIPLESGNVMEGIYNPASGAPTVFRPEVSPTVTDPQAVRSPDGRLLGYNIPTVRGTTFRSAPKDDGDDYAAEMAALTGEAAPQSAPAPVSPSPMSGVVGGLMLPPPRSNSNAPTAPKSRFKIIEVR